MTFGVPEPLCERDDEIPGGEVPNENHVLGGLVAAPRDPGRLEAPLRIRRVHRIGQVLQDLREAIGSGEATEHKSTHRDGTQRRRTFNNPRRSWLLRRFLDSSCWSTASQSPSRPTKSALLSVNSRTSCPREDGAQTVTLCPRAIRPVPQARDTQTHTSIRVKLITQD